jgi:hypothetical protein
MSSVAPFGAFGDVAADSGRRTIPFDYAFRYRLTGSPATVLNSTVTVSVEATFVAVSVGYGVIPAVSPVTIGLPPPPPAPPTPSPTPIILAAIKPKTVPEINLGDFVQSLKGALVQTSRTPRGDSILGAALRSGIRLNPRFADVALNAIEKGVALSPSIAARLFEVVSPPADQIQFLYALFDEGTGREFQSEPILNTAGLGISNGDRPFRYFPQPIIFKPRSTIRLQITEVSDFQGDLHISLQGYKVLGESGTPTARLQSRLRRRRGMP